MQTIDNRITGGIDSDLTCHLVKHITQISSMGKILDFINEKQVLKPGVQEL